jgi:hypothetical protein
VKLSPGCEARKLSTSTARAAARAGRVIAGLLGGRA